MAGDIDPKPSNEKEDPYYDPFDEYGPFSEEELRNFISSPNPNLMDLSFTENTILPPSTPNLEINEAGVLQELTLSIDTIDEFVAPPFEDDHTLSWDMFDIPISDDLNDTIIGDIVNDNGNIIGETSGLELSTRVLGENSMRFETDGISTTTIKPTVSEGILVCSCCNPLRGLVHTNGQEMTRLDIHGGIGYVCHAILKFQGLDGSMESRRHQTLHLKDLTMEEVKRFIEEYCWERQVCGFEVVEDTNADFYQAMNACSINNQSCDDVLMSLTLPDEPTTPMLSRKKDKRKTLTPLAVQRERTGKLTLKDIGMYFHLPIEEAARKLNLCPTVAKKICRKGGLSRWPHRKIKSLEKKILKLRSVLSTETDEGVRTRAKKEIETLQKNIDDICSESLKNFK